MLLPAPDESAPESPLKAVVMEGLAVGERGVQEEVMVPKRTRVKAVKVVMEPAVQAAVEEEDAEPEVAMVVDPMVTVEPMAKPEMGTPAGQGGTGCRHRQGERQDRPQNQRARQG